MTEKTEKGQIREWLEVARKVPLRHVVKQFVDVYHLERGSWTFKCPSCGQEAMGVNRLNVWHCFRCRDGGGQTQYLMRHGLTHQEALKWLVEESKSE